MLTKLNHSLPLARCQRVALLSKWTNPEAPGGGHGQVWVNTEAGVYHREGSPFYGTTRTGKYMTEQDAIRAGGQACAEDLLRNAQ